MRACTLPTKHYSQALKMGDGRVREVSDADIGGIAPQWQWYWHRHGQQTERLIRRKFLNGSTITNTSGSMLRIRPRAVWGVGCTVRVVGGEWHGQCGGLVCVAV